MRNNTNGDNRGASTITHEADNPMVSSRECTGIYKIDPKEEFVRQNREGTTSATGKRMLSQKGAD